LLEKIRSDEELKQPGPISLEKVERFAFKHRRRLLLVCIILLFAFTITSLGDPFTEDELDFINSSVAITEKGFPEFYKDEMRPVFEGLWHPPLFVYTIALSFKIFGISESAARIVTVASCAATLLVTYLLALEVVDDKRKRYTVAISSSFLLVLSPFFIQSSLLIDIDNSLLMFGTTAFLWLFIRHWKKQEMMEQKYLLLLGFLFGGIIWVKFGTAPAIILALFLFLILNRKYKQGIFYPLVILVIGFALFYATWRGVAQVTGLTFSGPFDHNFSGAGNAGFRSNDPGYIGYVLGGRFKLLLFWMGIPFGVLLLLTFLHRLKKFRVTKKLEPIDLPLLLAVIIFIEYMIFIGIAYNFPKYFIPMMPLAVIPMMDYILDKKSVRMVLDSKVLLKTVAISAIVIMMMEVSFIGDRFKDPTDLKNVQRSD